MPERDVAEMVLENEVRSIDNALTQMARNLRQVADELEQLRDRKPVALRTLQTDFAALAYDVQHRITWSIANMGFDRFGRACVDAAVYQANAHGMRESDDRLRAVLDEIDEVTGPYDDGYVEEVKGIINRNRPSRPAANVPTEEA